MNSTSALNFSSLPSDFLCPITNQLFIAPVISHHGISYERAAIVKWIQQDGKQYCPVTGLALGIDSLEPNKGLQWKIRYWKMKNGYGNSETTSDDTTSTVFNHHTEVTSPSSTSTTTEATTVSVPQERFLCSLTKKIMKDPVITCHGYNFERKAILRWISVRGEICPLSGKPLKLSKIVSNVKLEWEIRKWKEQEEVSKSSSSTTQETLPQSEPSKQQDSQYTWLATMDMTEHKNNEGDDELIATTTPKARTIKNVWKRTKDVVSRQLHHIDEISFIL